MTDKYVWNKDNDQIDHIRHDDHTVTSVFEPKKDDLIRVRKLMSSSYYGKFGGLKSTSHPIESFFQHFFK